VEIDGVAQPVTEDFSESRINVAVVGDGDTQYVVRATTDDGTVLGERDTAGLATVPVASVAEGVAGYPACGTEPITSDGVTWYPVATVGGAAPTPELQAELDAILAVDREPSPVDGPSGLVRVVAPGPGDDVGTLVVWADGVARWTSDSGDLDVWLVDRELTYDWVC